MNAMRYAVKAETHEGNTFTLRYFPTRRAAEDHPVRLASWKRVWVERTVIPAVIPAPDPDLPWTIETIGTFTYIRDSHGRRVLSVHGKPERREKIIAMLAPLLEATR